MAGISGKDGSVAIGASTMAEVTNWNADVSCEMLEDTSLGDEWKSNVPGLSEWSASVEVSWSMGDTAQVAVQNAFLAKTSVTPKLYVNSANYYTGTAYISSLSIETPVDNIVTCSMELTGSGELTYA